MVSAAYHLRWRLKIRAGVFAISKLISLKSAASLGHVEADGVHGFGSSRHKARRERRQMECRLTTKFFGGRNEDKPPPGFATVSRQLDHSCHARKGYQS